MKTNYPCISLIILFLTRINLSVAKACPHESFYFFDQIFIDQFSTDYPDCETIYGDVTISGYINNLEALSNIRVITGNLVIESTSELTDLSGLENLDSVYG